MQATSFFTHRVATEADVPEIKRVMDASISDLQKAHLTDVQIEASRQIMGLDTQLIKDQTYFVVMSGGQVVGCGGWSRRGTLFGGDHTGGRSAVLLDPEKDPARIRAMYTDPQWARRGIAKLIMTVCEDAARAEGFLRAELASTLAGESLYRRCGYTEVRRWNQSTPSGIDIPLVLMQRTLAAPVTTDSL